jgi:hypothetical protein
MDLQLGPALGVGLGFGEDKDTDKKPKNVEAEVGVREEEEGAEGESDSSYTSLSTGLGSPSQSAPPAHNPAPTRRASPARVPTRSTTTQAKEGVGGRTPRISREDVQKRLKGRGGESPIRVGTSPQRVRGDPAEGDREHEEEEDGGDGGEGGGKRMSTMTDFDLSNTEIGTIETVTERKQLRMQAGIGSAVSPGGLPDLSPSQRDGDGDASPVLPDPFQPDGDGSGMFDLGQFGLGGTGVGKGMSIGYGEVDVDMRSALDRLMDDVAGSAGAGGVGKEGVIGMGRRVEVVMDGGGVKAGRFEVDESVSTDGSEEGRGFGLGLSTIEIGTDRPPLARAATEPDLFTKTGVSRTDSGSTIPPPPPPKDAIRSREELVLEKRREARRREEDESMGYYTPPRPSDRALAGNKQSGRRRSRSTGDMRGAAGALLDVEGLDDDLGASIQRELRKLTGVHSVSVSPPFPHSLLSCGIIY